MRKPVTAAGRRCRARAPDELETREAETGLRYMYFCQTPHPRSPHQFHVTGIRFTAQERNAAKDPRNETHVELGAPGCENP